MFALHMLKLNNEKIKRMETAMLSLGFLKLSLGNEDVLQHHGFLTFLFSNQIKNHFCFWNAEVVIFICSLRSGLILEPLKYSKNTLGSIGESVRKVHI